MITTYSAPSPMRNMVKRAAVAVAANAVRSAVRNPRAVVQVAKKAANAAKNYLARRAKRQQTQSTIIAPARMSAPLATSSIDTPYFRLRQVGDAVVINGRELFAPSVYLGANEELSNVVAHNPAYWQGTRVSIMSQCYQLYSVKRLRLVYVPKVSASTAGAISMGTLFSPIPSGSSDVNVVCNGMGGVRGPVWEPLQSSPDLARTPLRWYPFFDPATFRDYAYLTAVVPSAASVDYGSLFVEYEVHMTMPLYTRREVVTSKRSFVSYEVSTGIYAWRSANAYTKSTYSDLFGIVTGAPNISYVTHNCDVAEEVYLTYGVYDSAGSGYQKFIIKTATGDEITPTASAQYMTVYTYEVVNYGANYPAISTPLNSGGGSSSTTTTVPFPASTGPKFPTFSMSEEEAAAAVKYIQDQRWAPQKETPPPPDTWKDPPKASYRTSPERK